MKIIFYAPLGLTIKDHKIGGAEMGCRRTVSILQCLGMEVIVVDKPAKVGTGLKNSFLHLSNLLITYIKLVRLFSKLDGARLHIAGFYLKQVYIEWLIAKTAKLFGIPVLYEIRNGGMIEAFEEGSKFYQYAFKKLIKSSNTVICQGSRYVPFLLERFSKDSIYYPNYILDQYITIPRIKRDVNAINLVYFGRVVRDKGVDLSIMVCQKLVESGHEVHFNIIGGYDTNYYNELMMQIKEKGLLSTITFHGRMDLSSIVNVLNHSHFFLFPSKEKREGHSNSLTEAMASGVVPIASDAGFNREIIGEDDLIVKSAQSQDYHDIITTIWEKGSWDQYSQSMYERALSNYSEQKAKENLSKAYGINLV
jgi:glycosyltransferase involved in cell wall biosynthesis